MKKHIVAGNWKLYIEGEDAAKKLAAALARKARSFLGVETVLFPPFPFIPVLSKTLEKSSAIAVGAQTVSAFEGGAHTGEVSAALVKDAGATWALVGHSERRAKGESEESVRAQIQAAEHAGLKVLLCVGELERDPAGGHFSTITAQLSSALADAAKKGTQVVVAYEPVWAIGKTAAEAMKPAELQEMVIFIRKTLADLLGRTAALKVPILYGGSVDGTNAQQLLAEGGVSGFLVGRASADADSFLEILHACKK